MIVHHAKTITANNVDALDEVHVEAITLSGEKVYLVVPRGGEETFSADVDEAVSRHTEAYNRGAAGAWDRGAA